MNLVLAGVRKATNSDTHATHFNGQGEARNIFQRGFIGAAGPFQDIDSSSGSKSRKKTLSIYKGLRPPAAGPLLGWISVC